ncbi:[protein-PII] uridylyltransferase [Candidatus Foliamicus sp.]
MHPEPAVDARSAGGVSGTRDARLKAWRARIEEHDKKIRVWFEEGTKSAQELLNQRAGILDSLLCEAWRLHAGPALRGASLLAVGGYGRAEMYPASDVDVLVLLPQGYARGARAEVGEFLAFLWDTGLKIGHGARTVAESRDRARADVTIMTALMEARLLSGSPRLFAQLSKAINARGFWTAAQFYRAKRDEQAARRREHGDSASNLEPDVKNGPGGLRNLHTVNWITLRHFGEASLGTLLDRQLMSAEQLQALRAARDFLSRVRFALHLNTGRMEDRLLFDCQKQLAAAFGYHDRTGNRAVEQFMQRYYRTTRSVSLASEIALQRLGERISPARSGVRRVNARFVLRDGYLDARRPELFQASPRAVLEPFLLRQRQPEIRGFSAAMVEALIESVPKIDDRFRANPKIRRMFMEILTAPPDVPSQLEAMNRYGVLGAYIPEFGRITGRMQFDLFHSYTVDAHSLRVVRNLRRFGLADPAGKDSALAEIMQRIENPGLLYVAGLYHDIAKGRGGDHSALGAADAETFALNHGLSDRDAALVAWLVRHHLTLSMTAQKKDVYDPAVVAEFARLVGDQAHLDHLYLLTVADVRGTNPNLWTAWKARAFEDLYLQTKRALRMNIEQPSGAGELLAERKRAALRELSTQGLAKDATRTLWSRFEEDYFWLFRSDEIVWHTQALHAADATTGGFLVATRADFPEGNTAILVHGPATVHRFFITCAALDAKGLNILDARILPSGKEQSLAQYLVVQRDGDALRDARQLDTLRTGLRAALARGKPPRRPARSRLPRKLRAFEVGVQVSFRDDDRGRHTVMELVTADRPGLLGLVGGVLTREGIGVRTARIATIGERAEDVFHLTDGRRRKPLSEAQREALQTALESELADAG